MRWLQVRVLLLVLSVPCMAGAQEAQLETSNGTTTADASVGANGDGQSDSEPMLEGRVGLGFALPAIADEFTDSYNPGGLGMAELGLGMGDVHLALGASYARLPLNQGTQSNEAPSTPSGETVTGIEIDGGTLNLLALQIVGRYDIPFAELVPYVIAGGGVAFAFPETATIKVTTQDTDGESRTTRFEADADNTTDPTAMLGFGAYYDAGFYDIFAQLHANVLFGDEVVPIAIVSVGMGF